MSTVKLWRPLLVIAFAGAACHTRPPATSPSRTAAPAPAAAVPARPPAPPAPAPPPPRTTAAGPATPVTEEELFRRKSLNDLNAEHPLSDVFFDYDQTTLRDDARRLLQQDAQWLSKWSQAVIRIDGHCDERGSAEYNLSLGDRRAEVVREYLTSLGVRPERMQARSLGKEAPFCQDSGESCWSQNRRDHFEITAK
jgi:peptidoglycan-associated lipoprotein